MIWPSAARGANARLIPAATESLVVQVKDGDTVLTSQTATRPASGNSSTLTFNNLPVHPLVVIATAYPTGDTSGTPLSTGAINVTIKAGETVSETLTMASTIDHLAVDYSRTDILQGVNVAVTATAYDADNHVVMLSPSALNWTSSDDTKVSVTKTDTGAKLTGVGAGTVSITVTDSESGKSKEFSALGMTFTLSPATTTLSVNETADFTAAIAGPSDTAFTWSVVEDGGGTITDGGHYTAPATPGTYHIKATSHFNADHVKTATITVQAGNANVTVQ